MYAQDLVGGNLDIIGASRARYMLAQQAAANAQLNALAPAGGGRRPLPPSRWQYQQQMAAAACPPANAMQATIIEEPFTKVNGFPIGFGRTVVAAGASAQITVQPQEPFKGKRLIIPSTVAAAFSVTDVRVGNKSQLVVAGSIPALAFSEAAFGVELSLTTAQVSQFIQLDVTNNTAAAATFEAALIGVSVS